MPTSPDAPPRDPVREATAHACRRHFRAGFARVLANTGPDSPESASLAAGLTLLDKLFGVPAGAVGPIGDRAGADDAAETA